MSAIRFTRTQEDSTEILTVVRLDSGPLAIEICAGPEIGDDFVGLYDLEDGTQLRTGKCSWEVVDESELTADRINAIAADWETGTSRVARLAS